MGDKRETEYTYPEILEQFRKRRNEAEILYPLMERIKAEVDLESVETCLSIGTGTGEYDVAFIKRCLPNLKQFIAVERNADCAAKLRSNLQTSLPHLDKVIHQESIEEWKGPGCRVDVILVLHMLYDLKKEDRLKLMEKCFQSWLKPSTGVMVVVHMSDEEEPVNVMQMIYREMDGWNLLLEAKEVKEEILSMGHVIHPVFKYECTLNLQNLDAGTLKMLHACETYQTDEGNIRKMLTKIAPNGTGKYIGELFVVKGKAIDP